VCVRVCVCVCGSSPANGVAFNNWVAIDCNDTMNANMRPGNPLVTYSLAMTQMPNPLYVLGARMTGPLPGYTPLNAQEKTVVFQNDASGNPSNLAAYFLPTRAGTYEVSLLAVSHARACVRVRASSPAPPR
jgi:hypothetical protein